MSPRSPIQRFIGELRRRHVPQTAAIYLVVAWAAIEFSDVVVPNLNWPSWVVPAVIVAAAVGLPAVLVLAWIYDWGPEGLHRTGPASEGESAFDDRAGAPWVAAVSVLAVAIVTAVAVAALVAGGEAPNGDAGGETSTSTAEEADAGGAPEPPEPPSILAPGFQDSVMERVARDFRGLQALEGLDVMGALEDADLSDVAEIGRRMAERAGLAVLFASPPSWRAGTRSPAPLARGDTMEVRGIARDTAGVTEVRIDGRSVARTDEPEELLRFETVLVGTGSAGLRTIPIEIRTADDRVIEREYLVTQLPARQEP